MYIFLLTCSCPFSNVLNIHAFMMLFVIVCKSEMRVNQIHISLRFPTLQIRNFDGKFDVLFKRILHWLDFKKTSLVSEFSGVH